MSYFVHVDNKKKDILNLGDGHTEGLEHTRTSEKMFSINFTVIQINFVWACIIMEQIVIYLLMVQKSINLKTKDSEIVATPLYNHFKGLVSR